MAHEIVLILDFGGQYNQLIARRVRDMGIYCEIIPYKKATVEAVKEKAPIGIIFTGGPNSVYLETSPKVDPAIFELGIPVLGICYGNQLMAHTLGGKVGSGTKKEYGKTETHFESQCCLFKDLPETAVTWMSHTDLVEKLPEGFTVTAYTSSCPVAAMANPAKNLYGLQFHPEVLHTENGLQILRNFLYQVCRASGDWSMKDYCSTVIEDLRAKIGGGKVLLALSGGVDSSVVAKLLSKAVGSQLTCIFVDHGLMRKNEGDEIEAVFGNGDINFVRVNAEERFLGKLAGVSDPEKKRKIIGEEFIRVFEEEAKKIGAVDFLAQGTIYADIVESGVGNAAVIKSHHNVGGLPEDMEFEGLVEPLRDLFKDEVRRVGIELGIPEALVWRQPFPGPGLAVRIMGEITQEKVALLQDADAIFREEVTNFGLERDINQYFAVLTANRSVGVMGDGRTYGVTVALRAVTTTDFMTADWARLPYELLGKVSNRIINEVEGVNRVVYDVTSKPPATIEFE